MARQLIALASLKGGCGKSTLALNLAAGLARRGQVGLLDADPQGALRHWAAWGPEQGLPEVLAGGEDPVAALSEAARQFPTVVVDCPPSLDMVITGALLERVDIVLIPVLPSALDLWAGAGTVVAVGEARKRNPKLRAWMLLNQVEPRSALSRAMTQALAGLEIPTLKSLVRRRAAFRLAAVEGVGVYQLGARGREAAREMDHVIEEALAT
jgi:chromosome partitioning protein